MDEHKRLKQVIKRSVALLVVVVVAAVIAVIILKYHVEGEQNMPFELSQVLVVSTAEGNTVTQDSKAKWDVEIYQTNDVYLTISKNKNYKDTHPIKSIELRNISVDSKPMVGNLEFYLPAEGENTVYTYQEDKKIGDSITFQGDEKSDISNLKIANQGGTILFRIVNKTGMQYQSNEEELKHDGTLLNKVGLTANEVKGAVSFETVICLENDVTFVGKVTIPVPTGDIETQGVSSIDQKQLDDIVFKRINLTSLSKLQNGPATR